MFDTRKGKYTDEENERIIQKINEGREKGMREREILKELSNELNRGFAGVMSHARKLRHQFPERFPSDRSSSNQKEKRLNSWTEKEEDRVIEMVNHHLDQGKPLTSALTLLEKELNRTPGAIYQRIYTLRQKSPERFHRMPERRPRRRRTEPWQEQYPMIRDLDGSGPLPQEEVAVSLEAPSSSQDSSPNTAPQPTSPEEEMVLMAFERRFGKLNSVSRNKLISLMKKYGSTRVTIELFTLQSRKEFPTAVTHFLEQQLKRNHQL